MKSIILRLLVATALVLAVTSKHNRHHSPPHEARGPHTDEVINEIHAAKQPIISHLLIMLTTMYHGIKDYEMIPGPTGEDQPYFCHKYECAKYTVLCKNAFYEVRKYAVTKFVATSVPFDTIQDPLMVGFKRLYGYFSGENSEGAEMPMTRPISIHTKCHKGGANNTSTNGTIGSTKSSARFKNIFLYLPSEYHKNPPAPTNPEVRIVDSPEHIFYVKMFSGLVLRQLWRPKKERFLEELNAFNQTADPDFKGLFLVYDKPSILLGRHNEILALAADAKEDQNYCTLG